VLTRHFPRESSKRSSEISPMRGEQARFPQSPLRFRLAKQGKQNAGKPGITYRILFGCGGALLRTRRLAGAPLAVLSLWDFAPQRLRSRPGFLGRGLRMIGKGSCEAKKLAGVTRLLLSQSSGSTPRRSVVPASMMPGPARERSVWLRPRAPHPLHLGEYPRPKVPLSERDLFLRAETGTYCQYICDYRNK
jgi:hypothetical protein